MDALIFEARLRLLSTEEGGRKRPISGEYRPMWDLGGTDLGEPVISDGRVTVEAGSKIDPGHEGTVLIQAVAPEYWGKTRTGSVITMLEGTRVVGYARVLGAVCHPPFFSPAVAAFVVEARQFCAFVGEANRYPLTQRLAAARLRLLRLYSAAVALPYVEPPEGVEYGHDLLPPPFSGFESLDIYWEVFDPYEQERPVAGSLSDDVICVSRDIMRGLVLWGRAVPKSAAIWEWRFSFDTHWGDHAIDALRALHRACGRQR